MRHITAIGKLFKQRAMSILIFAALFAVIGNQLYTLADKYYYSHEPASTFIDYYAFNVNNARAGEDVYFQVCRKHDQNYQYTGDLTVNVVLTKEGNAKDAETRKVYSRPLAGTLNSGECENKVLRASDFKHEPGNYIMRFDIAVKVKYDNIKRGNKDSNVYTIYPQPTDVQQQITYYQTIIDKLTSQLQSAGKSSATNNSSLKITNIPSTGSTQTQTISPQPQPTTEEQPARACLTVPILGSKLCL